MIRKILAALPLAALASGAYAAQGLSIVRVLEDGSGFCAESKCSKPSRCSRGAGSALQD